jgi:ATP-dependent RNA helicase SUPV3L1/SUV3
VTSPSSSKNNDIAQLDSLTGGAFSAPTAGERAARVREWLQTQPSAAQLADVFKELSIKDKGAAKLVREKLDEAKRAKGQESLATEWADKATALLAVGKLNIADAMAWQRDAAKAGAPLSKEPLAGLKTQLAERVRVVEDLQRQVQVQREAAVLLSQRIEVLSTKSWADAQAALEALRTDVEHWKTQAAALAHDVNWASVDGKYPPLLDASKGQLQVVWDAFQAALTQAHEAASNAEAPLPPVPMWANELRVARGIPLEVPAKATKPKIDPQLRAQAQAAVQDVLATLESEIAEGHGKASAGAAAALRGALKEHGRVIDSKLEHRAQAALAAAGELEGWQRWRADQLREELVTKAEGLLQRPEGQAMGGRKMQESLRTLRDQWKQTDQGGVANHGLWKRFDEACNEAYKVVAVWLDKVKAESAEHKLQRVALIEELNAWAAANPVALDDDWKGFNRILQQFASRWRDAGHLGEKVFAELQTLWKTAMAQAAAPLEAVQAQSVTQRQAMIEEAKLLGASPVLRVDAIRTLQQRWQALAHAVPIDRRQEQKMWDAFRKPIDDAFNRKSSERATAEAHMDSRDRGVLQAAKALEAANAKGDAQAIRQAMEALDAALRGQAPAPTHATPAPQAAPAAPVAPEGQKDVESPISEQNMPLAGVSIDYYAINTIANTPESAEAAQPDMAAAPADAPADAAPAPAPAKPAPKPVVAVRGDDRPGMRKEAPAPAGRGGKFGDAKDGARAGRDVGRGAGGRESGRDAGRGDGGRDSARREGFAGRDRGQSAPYDSPRLGDTAFRAQRDALENAQAALRKLAVQAHGEALTQLLQAWEKRDVALVPSTQELGAKVGAVTRNTWVKALEAAAGNTDAQAQALLRLEMAAEVPTPAEQMTARRMLQLQMLTQRNAPTPGQTWANDASTVLGAAYEPGTARRLQNVLKVLLKK